MSSTKTDQFAPIDYRAQLHASQERERGLVAELERQAKEKRAWNIDANNLRADLAKAQAESEAAAKRWDEENASLAAQLAKAQARCAELGQVTGDPESTSNRRVAAAAGELARLRERDARVRMELGMAVGRCPCAHESLHESTLHHAEKAFV